METTAREQFSVKADVLHYILSANITHKNIAILIKSKQEIMKQYKQVCKYIVLFPEVKTFSYETLLEYLVYSSIMFMSLRSVHQMFIYIKNTI